MKQAEEARTQYQLLSQKYALRNLRLTLEGQTFDLAVVSDEDDLLDELLEKGDDHPDVIDERLPYWATLWPSAVGLAIQILRSPHIASGTSVLEIGCGLGLPALAAAKKGASVYLTDYLPEALEMARLNFLSNGEPAPPTRLMDWREPDPALAAEVLLASDVAYEERAFDPLFRSFRQLLKPGGRLMLSEPNRPVAKPFVTALREQNWQVRESIIPVELETVRSSVSVYEIQLDS
jgi:predicted nicotinamide N-methyase